jgi:hypothetical protein
VAIPVGTVGSENRDRFRRSVLEPLFASTYVRRIYRRGAGTETDLSRGYENGEFFVFGDGGINFRDLDEVSSESFDISYDWREAFWDNWSVDIARLWLTVEIEPRLRQALIFLNNVYGPLDRYDAELGTERGADTMRFLGLAPGSTASINLFNIGSDAAEKRNNAKRIVQTLLMFDDGYGCISREQRQSVIFAYPVRMPVKFTNAYFGARFTALGYSDISPITGEVFVSIANLPDIEDGEGLLGPDPRTFVTWTESAFPGEEEAIISPGSGVGSTIDIRPGTRDIQCPIRPRPASSFGGGTRPTAAETPLPCPEDDLEEGLSREEICRIDISAQIPEWTADMEPFLNSRVCEYYIPIQTTYECVGADELPSRIEEYVDQAIQRVLDFLNKQATDAQRQTLRSFILNTGYYEFDKAPNVDVKFLYRWPFGLVKALRLQNAIPQTLGTAQPLGSSVEISTFNVLSNLDTLKLILETLSPQQIDMWSSKREKILLEGTAREANLVQESKDIITFRTAMTNFLNSNNFILPTTKENQSSNSQFPIPSEGIVVDSLQLYYNEDFSLSGLFARQQSTEYQQLNIGNLPPSSPLRNPTMLSYFVKLQDMVTEYNNSQNLNISNFLQSYHYPPVRVATQASISDAPLLPASCSGGALEDAANSVLDSFVDAAKEFAGRFSNNLCMTAEEAAQREAQIESSIEELKNILSDENMKSVALQDPIIANIGSIINGISDSRDTITAAWSNLFDKLTACGLFTLTSKTIETVAKNDICGISPETALITAIKASLKKTEAGALRNLFNGLPANLREEIQTAYSERFREYATQTGYSGPSGFPWDLEEQNRQLERDRKQGRVLYDGSLFTAPSLEQTETRYQNSYRAGYGASAEFDTSFFVGLSSGAYDEGSFWSGYVAAEGDISSGTVLPPSSVIAPARSDVLTDAQRLQSNSPSVNSSAFGQLAGGLVADTINFAFDSIVEILTEVLSFDELLEQVNSIPVLASILKTAGDITKCAVDVKFTSGQEGGAEINLSSLQRNLQDGLKGDICEVVGGLQALTLPDIEATLNTALNTETLKAAFVNALLPVLKNLLIKILINTLLQLIKKATQVLQGALCEATRSNISAAIEGSIAGNAATQVYTPPGNIADLFADAFCGPGEISGLDDQVSSLISSMSGAPVTDGSCSLIDRLSARLRMDQLLDLMQGTPSESVVQVVLSISNNECPEFSEFLFDEASVINFFTGLSTAFPQQFLNDTRNTLEAFGGDRQNIITTCNIEPNLSGFEQALREECGSSLSEEQIQNQVNSIQERIKDTISDLASAMTTGFSESMTDTIQSSMSNIVPKDDPSNVVLVKQIVDSMFDPLYNTYANGLLNPIAPNGNGGYMNVVLSNRNSTPLVGQHVQLGAAIATLTGPLFVLLPPPLSGVASAELIDQLKFSYFGDRPGETAPQLKPDTVAQHLRDLFADGTYISTSSEDDTFDESVSLSYIGTLTLPTFDINYNFATGQGEIQRYDIFGSPALTEGSVLSLASSDPSSTYERIESYLNNTLFGASPNDVYDTFFGTLERAPLPVGASALLYNVFITNTVDLLNPDTWSFPTVSLEDLASNTVALLNNIRGGAFRSLGRSVSFNENAFSYGNYNLDPINDNDITPTVNPDLIDQGYNIFYLDDGNIVVIPPRKGGWLELKDILLPNRQDQYCCPEKKELLDLPSIKEAVLKAFESSDEDERLYENPRTVREPPYSHIIGRATSACLEGAIATTIRIYLIENILNGYASFSKYKTDFPAVYSDVMADYIASKIKAGLKTQKPNPAGPPFPPGEDAALAAMRAQIGASLGIPPDVLAAGAATATAELGFYGYWYEFLEQCVQSYINRAEAGTITITQEADVALREISNFSRDYLFPQRSELREARRTRPFITLKKLRREKNILAIQATEELANVILKELIKEEFNRVSRDIENIFPSPGGGWISDIAVDFLRNGYYIANRNIFDVPRVDGDILNGERGELNFDGNGHFVLQSYIRPTLNELSPRYPSLSDNIISGQIYGLQEMRERMELSGFVDYGTGFGGDNNINDHFASFRYGLRLVYVLGDQTVVEVGGSDSALITLLNRDDDISRLYRHPSDSPGMRYSMPIVFSEAFEKQFEDSQITVFFRNTQPGILSLQSIDNSNHFDWPLLIQMMISSYEFQTIFDYAVPLTTIQSLNTMFNIESFLESVGRDDEWNFPNVQIPIPEAFPIPRLPGPMTYLSWNKKAFPQMKRRLKKLFNLLYRANDFSYNPSNRSANNEEVTELSEGTSADSWSERLTPETRSRIIIEDPTCFDGETPSE